jgi:hypothetical protein
MFPRMNSSVKFLDPTVRLLPALSGFFSIAASLVPSADCSPPPPPSSELERRG